MNEKWWKNLQPLRIPQGWTFLFNKLENVEPEELSKEDEIWLFQEFMPLRFIDENSFRKDNNYDTKQ